MKSGARVRRGDLVIGLELKFRSQRSCLGVGENRAMIVASQGIVAVESR